MRNKPLCMCRTDQISRSIFTTMCLGHLHTYAKLVRRHALIHTHTLYPSEILYESECFSLFLLSATRHRNPCKQSKDKRPTTTINEKCKLHIFSILFAHLAILHRVHSSTVYTCRYTHSPSCREFAFHFIISTLT